MQSRRQQLVHASSTHSCRHFITLRSTWINHPGQFRQIELRFESTYAASSSIHKLCNAKTGPINRKLIMNVTLGATNHFTLSIYSNQLKTGSNATVEISWTDWKWAQGPADPHYLPNAWTVIDPPTSVILNNSILRYSLMAKNIISKKPIANSCNGVILPSRAPIEIRTAAAAISFSSSYKVDIKDDSASDDDDDDAEECKERRI